jgi:hypothetical protein
MIHSLAAAEALHYRGAAPGAERDRRQRMNKKLEEKKNKERLSKIVKLPENKKCFDCAGRGRTQYVVMPLWTFVCTGCSGVHREFSHRVLSITLHSFTKDQIDLLESGGNQAAKARWLASWDSRDFPMPVSKSHDIRLCFSRTSVCTLRAWTLGDMLDGRICVRRTTGRPRRFASL